MSIQGTWKHASTLLTTGGEVTRVWYLEECDTSVVLRHFPLTDERVLTVNGITQSRGAGPAAAQGGGAAQEEMPFRLADGRSGCVRVEPVGNWMLARAGLGAFLYRCEVDGARRRENNERAADAVDPKLAAAETDVRFQPTVVLAGDAAAWYRFTRPGATVLVAATGTRVAVPAVDVHRRFRDFYILYAQVCSAFRGTHLYSSVPTPPPKEIPGVADHSSPAFLEQRRVGLQAWLRKLLALPGVAGGVNPDVQEFLGLGGPRGVREISVVFTQPVLGIRLMRPPPLPPLPGGRGGGGGGDGAGGEGTTSGFSAQVVEVTPGSAASGVVPDGAPQSRLGDDPPPCVMVGDMITRVAGESALLVSYDTVIGLLKTAPRPLMVHFLGVREEAPFVQGWGAAPFQGEAARPPAPPPRSPPRAGGVMAGFARAAPVGHTSSTNGSEAKPRVGADGGGGEEDEEEDGELRLPVKMG